MSWRGRSRNDRSDALGPSPDDASPAQREAYLREQRALHRKHQRRVVLGGGIGSMALLAIGTVLLLYWLLMTIGGRDLLLRQIVARLPAGTVLTWQSAEGPAAGPMVLRGVHFSMPRQRDPDCVPTRRAPCAMGRIVFDAEQVTLDPAIRPLLGRTLRLDALHIEGATLDLPRSDKPFELPRWPDVLPQIEPPLALRADTIRIDGLKVAQEGEALIDIRSARGGLHAARGSLHIEQLAIDSDRGRFSVHGDYLPRANFRSDLLVTAVLPAPAGQTAPRFGLRARGDLSEMQVAIGGRAPAPLRAILTLRGDKDRPGWQLRANSDALDLGLLSGSGEASTPLAFDLTGDGIGGSANLQGRVQHGDFAATLQPSKLSLEDRVLTVQPLVLDVFGGRVTANGTADLRQAGEAAPGQFPIRMAVNARRLRWQGEDGKTMVVGDADFGIAGTPDAWSVNGQARLQRGNERATVTLTGSGDRERMRVDAVRARMPQGRLDASGNVAWSPRLALTANATLAGFDPGYFAPDWPGAINGVLRVSGERRDNGSLRADVEASNVGGTLRGRALRGRGKLNIDGDNYAGEVALSVGASRIDARGRLGRNIEVDANFAPLQLADLLPDGRGSVRGTLALRGARNAPDVDVDLHGEGVAFGEYRAERLLAKGRLPGRNGAGVLAVDAQGLQLGLPLSSLRAGLRGSMERLQFDAEADSDFGALAVRGNANRQGARWHGALDSLQFDPTKGAAWTLQHPTRWSWDGNSAALSRACLLSNAGGTLCADADWPRRSLDLDGDRLPLALLGPYLPEREDGRAWQVDGEAALVARIVPAGNAWRGTVSITSADGGLRGSANARRNLIGYRSLSLDATFDPQRVEATLGAAFNEGGRIDARVATGWDAYAPLSGEVKVAIDELIWMELFSPDIVEPSGRLDAHLQLAGTLAQPAIRGEGRLQDFATELPALGIALSEGDVRLSAQADGNARIVGSVRSGDGVLEVEGTLGWRTSNGQAQDTPLVLRLRGSNVLVADTRQLRAVANPDLVVRYRAGQPLQVSGSVTVPEADINLERLNEGVPISEDVVVLDPVDPERERSNSLDLDLALVMGERVNIKGFGLVGTLGGSLRVRAEPGREMRGTGMLEVAGRYTAYGQRLQITRGRLLWANTPVGDPRLDLRAQREVGEVTAGIKVEGRASAPRASVFSDPAMSESEALAYLTLGRPLSSLTGNEASQLVSARSALSAGTRLLAAELGGRLGLDDAGVVESRALGSDVLTIGKYLSPRLYVGYGVSLLGTGQVLTLKYLLRRGFEIQIESSTVENRASVNWRKEK